MLNEFEQLKQYDSFIRNTFKGQAAQQKLQTTLDGIFTLVEDYVAFTGRDLAHAKGCSDRSRTIGTPLATPVDKAYDKYPGPMTELMKRFGKTVPPAEAHRSSRKKARPPELDLSRIRAGSTTSSRISGSPSRRRKSARPRKLAPSPVRKLVNDVDSTLDTPNEHGETSRFPTPTLTAQLRHKPAGELGDDLVNTSSSLAWTNGLDFETASLTSQLGEKLIRDEVLPQKLADEINRAGQGMSASNITEPIIDDILSNFVGAAQETRHGTEEINGQHCSSSSDFRIATPKDFSNEPIHAKVQAQQYRKKRTVAKAFPTDPFSCSRATADTPTPMPKRRGTMSKKSGLPENLDVESFLDTLSYD